MEFAQNLLDRFDEIDTNGDGMLSREEVLAAFAGFGAAFDRLDTNGDGFLSQAELEAGAGIQPPAGCVCNKTMSPLEIQKYLGDLFLLGVALLALFAIPRPTDRQP